MLFLNKMAAPKDPIVVSEEAYAVQVRSRTGLDAEAVLAALAGGQMWAGFGIAVGKLACLHVCMQWGGVGDDQPS